VNNALPSQQRTQVLSEPAYHEIDFPALRLARSSRHARRIAKWLIFAMAIALLAMFFLPWQQSIRGDGAVVAFDPVNRPQAVQAPIKGVIAEIGKGIFENARVVKGQLVYRIADQDPQYLERLKEQIGNTEDQLQVARQRLERADEHLIASKRVVNEKEEEIASAKAAQRESISAAGEYIQMADNKLLAEKAGLAAAEDAVWQAKLDFQRKKDLNSKGLETGLKFQEADLKLRQANAKKEMAEQYVQAAQNEVEAKNKERAAKSQEWHGKINKIESEFEKSKSDVAKSEIEVAKTREEISKIKNEIEKLETLIARQETQEVVAPRNGYIMRLVAYNNSAVVKQGETLFTIVPETDHPAVQVWVNGNDAPLISPGRHVRLQFEGWPAAQFSGWPSVAVGTFGGKVALVDPTDDGAGKFRVIIVPDEIDAAWPAFPYLRQGVRAHGWVLLDQVPLGYELWRRMNGFPPSLKSKKDAEKPKPPKVKV
jgi:multidrug resistance efflux pump